MERKIIEDLKKGYFEITVHAAIRMNQREVTKGDLIEVEAWVNKPGNLLHFCECIIYYTEDGNRIEIAKGFSTMCTVDKH